jgi:hypothetical protein
LFFVSLQHEIAASTDTAVRKYTEDTSVNDLTKEGVAEAMRSSIKDSTEKLYKKLSKIVSVANPALGRDWLEEVKSFLNIICEGVCCYGDHDSILNCFLFYRLKGIGAFSSFQS